MARIGLFYLCIHRSVDRPVEVQLELWAHFCHRVKEKQARETENEKWKHEKNSSSSRRRRKNGNSSWSLCITKKSKYKQNIYIFFNGYTSNTMHVLLQPCMNNYLSSIICIHAMLVPLLVCMRVWSSLPTNHDMFNWRRNGFNTGKEVPELDFSEETYRIYSLT